MAHSDATAAWAQLVDAAITAREVSLEQLQLFTTGAQRHPQLVDKECACARRGGMGAPRRL
jgi:hypothetical protein